MSVKKYERGKAVQLTANFRSTEFDCKGRSCGCTVTRVDSKLVRKLQVMRNLAGKAVTVTSGSRCRKHNASVGGASSSYHLNTKGQAADIVISGMSPEETARLAQSVGFNGIGCYSGSAGRFVHVDTRVGKYCWKNTAGRNVAVSGHGGTKEVCPYSLGSSVLRIGSRGDSVRALQWIVDRAGYSCSVDGIFGAETEAAVKAFQRGMNLESDGVAGALTLAAVREVYA